MGTQALGSETNRNGFKDVLLGPAQVIEWCIEQLCRLAGYYRQPSGSPVGEFRVAGATPDQINEKMLKRLWERIKEIREQAKIREHFIGQKHA